MKTVIFSNGKTFNLDGPFFMEKIFLRTPIPSGGVEGSVEFLALELRVRGLLT